MSAERAWGVPEYRLGNARVSSRCVTMTCTTPKQDQTDVAANISTGPSALQIDGRTPIFFRADSKRSDVLNIDKPHLGEPTGHAPMFDTGQPTPRAWATAGVGGVKS